MEGGDGEFVPLGKIEPGDEIVLASGGTAYVSCITRAPAKLLGGSEAVETYNLDVGSPNTYFVGQGGLWVHNEGSQNCKIVYTFYRHVASKAGDLNSRAAREAFFNKIFRPAPGSPEADLIRDLTPDQLNHLFDQVQDTIIRQAIRADGTIDWQKTMSYIELVDLRGRAGISGNQMPSHHGSVFRLMRDLLEAQPGSRTVLPKGTDPLLDGAPGALGPNEVPMPSMLMDVARHNEFHDILDRHLRAAMSAGHVNVYTLFNDLCTSDPGRAKLVLRQALQDSYLEMETLYGLVDDISYADMGKLSVGWINRILP